MKLSKSKFLFFLVLQILLFSGYSQTYKNPLKAEDSEKQIKWVDSVYKTLSVQERIGQLFMAQAFSNSSKQEVAAIEKLISNQKIGGLIFSKGGPGRQANLLNSYQKKASVPLLIGMDAEWGLSMRLDSTYAFPWNMTLGAVSQTKLIEETGRRIGQHCKRLGVHFNFAPVVDINTNPNNPIIGNRAFGESKLAVTKQSLAFMKGMQEVGVLACAKHFPGHGDTEADSHHTLPSISFSEQRIDAVELYPYKELIRNGLSSVMVAHLNIPSMISEAGFPSSLSSYIVTDKLKKELKFDGLIFTDALTMKGASEYGDSGSIDLAAFLAGNDVLLMSADVKAGINTLFKAYEKGQITEERLAYSVKKVLMSKYKVGLNKWEPIQVENIAKDLNTIEDDLLYEKLMESAITVLKNDELTLPIRDLETKKIAYLHLGDSKGTAFLNQLKKYTKVHEVIGDQLSEITAKLQNYNTVIIGFHKSNKDPWKSYKFTKKDLLTINTIAKSNKVILDVFARPYALNDLSEINNIEAIVLSYQNSAIAQEKSAQLIFGAIGAKGKIPVSTGENFKRGTGIFYNALNNLSYGIPESVDMNSQKLLRLDSLANYAVNKRMTPGIQMMVVRKGKVIYDKSFGYHTYEKKRPVQNTDLYDVASLTKILATLPLLMELEEKKVLTLNSKLGEILPYYKGSNKSNITIKQMLSHYARLKPWVPFYAATLDSTKQPSREYYRRKPSVAFSVEVTNNLFMRNDYTDSINKIIKESDLMNRLRYRYSDLPYYILKQYIETYYGQSLSNLASQHFYQSLGANNTSYNPREHYSLTQIIPTEVDTYYRYQEVHGFVHDMGAAMQNGVGGHAGLFSNANDIAKIMQMYLQKGFYGGKRYLKTETLDKFNKCYYCFKNNRRGVGFDKPQLEESGPTCGCVSRLSFGHTGFTGTMAWADPEEEIVYVFLANRTYPEAGKNLLLRENIRTEMQRFIYEAIIDKSEKENNNLAVSKT